MNNLIIKEASLDDLEELKNICKKTFYQTFSDRNTEEDMESYLKNNFSYQKLESEIKNRYSNYYLVQGEGKTAAYMKVNFDQAQTESGYNNSLEIQRIYVLEEYQGQHIGQLMINVAQETAEANKLDYLWLGVWEENEKAIGFYKKQGFEKFDSHIFKLGEDEQTDILMRLSLIE
jgi:hypothetical protein